MGLKTKILVTSLEIGAMLLVKIWAMKIAEEILPRGARVRKFPDGTPVVNLDDREYYGEPPLENDDAINLPRSQGRPNEKLREKARRLLQRWWVSGRNQFHKSHPDSGHDCPVCGGFDHTRRCRTLSADELSDTTYRDVIEGEIK